MSRPLLRQPWETWVVLVLGLWTLYSIYGYALGLRIFFRPDIVTYHGLFAELLLRLAGLVLLALGAAALFFKRTIALLLVCVGVLVYLAPWSYKYYELCVSQPQPHLTWHVIKTYPKLTWRELPLPFGILLFTALAVRRLAANHKAESDAQQAAGGSP